MGKLGRVIQIQINFLGEAVPENENGWPYLNQIEKQGAHDNSSGINHRIVRLIILVENKFIEHSSWRFLLRDRTMIGRLWKEV